MSEPAFRPDADQEWQQALRQLRHQSDAQPQPFFYARVQARLRARASVARFVLPQWLRWPAYAALLGVLVLAVGGDSVTATQNGRLLSHSAPPALP